MTPSSLKKLINSFHSVGKSEDEQSVRIKNGWISTCSGASICYIGIDSMMCNIHKSKLDHLKALAKEYGKEDIPEGAILRYADDYTPFARDIEKKMEEAYSIKTKQSITINFKVLEGIYKAMKCDSNNLRIDIKSDDMALISSENGDVSLIGLLE